MRGTSEQRFAAKHCVSVFVHKRLLAVHVALHDQVRPQDTARVGPGTMSLAVEIDGLKWLTGFILFYFRGEANLQHESNRGRDLKTCTSNDT